jgi:peptidoglycan hydrolase CwlO-like protein
MTQKKLRLNSSFEQHQEEIKELQKMVRMMHTDMGKLNDLIAKNSALQSELANATYTMEVTTV